MNNTTRSLPCQAVTEDSNAGESRRMVARIIAEHDVATARQQAHQLARDLQFRRVAAFELATSVSELAHNLWVHADHGGYIVLDVITHADLTGIQVTAQDSGPGIEDIARAMQDGFSTKGGLGSGLPGVVRLTDEFEIDSCPSVGTCITIRKWRRC